MQSLDLHGTCSASTWHAHEPVGDAGSLAVHGRRLWRGMWLQMRFQAIVLAADGVGLCEAGRDRFRLERDAAPSHRVAAIEAVHDPNAPDVERKARVPVAKFDDLVDVRETLRFAKLQWDEHPGNQRSRVLRQLRLCGRIVVAHDAVHTMSAVHVVCALSQEHLRRGLPRFSEIAGHDDTSHLAIEAAEVGASNSHTVCKIGEL